MPPNQAGKYLWLKFFLETTNEYITPTLQSVSVETAEIERKILRLTLTDSGRMRYPQGDVTVQFTGSLVGIGNSFVAPFTEAFTPTNIIPVFNPNSNEEAAKFTDVAVSITRTKINYVTHTQQEEVAAKFTNVSISVTRTHVSEIVT